MNIYIYLYIGIYMYIYIHVIIINQDKNNSEPNLQPPQQSRP